MNLPVQQGRQTLRSGLGSPAVPAWLHPWQRLQNEAQSECTITVVDLEFPPHTPFLLLLQS